MYVTGMMLSSCLTTDSFRRDDCSFGNSYHNNSSNTNKPLLQHHNSQMCFYWSRVLNLYSGKDIFHVSFIWKARVERNYIRNHPFCHDTDFHFPWGLFKMCILQSVSKTSLGQDFNTHRWTINRKWAFEASVNIHCVKSTSEKSIPYEFLGL